MQHCCDFTSCNSYFLIKVITSCDCENSGFLNSFTLCNYDFFSVIWVYITYNRELETHNYEKEKRQNCNFTTCNCEFSLWNSYFCLINANLHLIINNSQLQYINTQFWGIKKLNCDFITCNCRFAYCNFDFFSEIWFYISQLIITYNCKI